MKTLGWLIYLAGGVCGWMIHRAGTDGLMQAQAAAHKKEMDEIFDEVKRLRAQVAGLIGK
jgi:hypothetical protein